MCLLPFFVRLAFVVGFAAVSRDTLSSCGAGWLPAVIVAASSAKSEFYASSNGDVVHCR